MIFNITFCTHKFLFQCNVNSSRKPLLKITPWLKINHYLFQLRIRCLSKFKLHELQPQCHICNSIHDLNLVVFKIFIELYYKKLNGTLIETWSPPIWIMFNCSIGEGPVSTEVYINKHVYKLIPTIDTNIVMFTGCKLDLPYNPNGFYSVAK